MKERPLNLRAHEVQAVRNGRKTQLRRVINPQPEGNLCGDEAYGEWVRHLADACRYYPTAQELSDHEEKIRKGKRIFPFRDINGRLFSPRNPYGVPGDKLWVRETFAAWRYTSGEYPLEFDTIEGSLKQHTELFLSIDTQIAYRADGGDGGTWRASTQMPRWASRLTLEITDIKVQGISEEDAIAEGIKPVIQMGSYQTWVWVVEFKPEKIALKWG